MAAEETTDAAALERENAALRREVATLRQRQAASADILRTIVAAPGEAEGTLQKIAETAQRLLHARGTLVALVDGDRFRQAGVAGPQADEFVGRLAGLPVDETTGIGRAVLERRVVHLDDNRQVAHDIERGIARGRRLPPRTILAVPLMSGAKAIGVVAVNRLRKSPFDKADIKLLEGFADQAVIAIENARLLSELRESLERQTATSEVLGAISASPGELQPMFETIRDNALRLCEAANGLVFRIEDDTLYAVAHQGLSPQRAAAVESTPLRPGPDTPAMEMVRTAATVHVADLRETEAYRSGDQVVRDAADGSGFRTVLFVPMVKDGRVAGAINVSRREVRPFSDKQVALLESFAAQAVIAIENARLLSELRESLERQTATSEVLGAISASPGELQPMFETILDNALRLCEAANGLVFRIEDDAFSIAAHRGLPPQFVARMGSAPLRPGPGTPSMEMLRTAAAVHVADLRETESYRSGEPVVRAAVDGSGVRTELFVPMVKDGTVVGAINVQHNAVRPFSDKQVALLESFAAQAVIAIENARLLTELRESLDQQTATADVLGVISASPGEVKPVFDTIVASAARICDSPFSSLQLWVGDDFRAEATHGDLPQSARDWMREHGGMLRGGPHSVTGQVARTKELVHIADYAAGRAYQERDPLAVVSVERLGIRSILGVPMLRDNQLIGLITVFRTEVQPFTEKQIALVESFATQAVIAIENARLLSELRESLENQTASADILRAIASSPEDSAGVLDTIAQTTARLFDADGLNIRILEGGVLRYAASVGPTARRIRAGVGEGPPDPRRMSGAAILERRQIHIAGLADPAERAQWPTLALTTEDDGSAVATPLMRRGEAIGALVVLRKNARPFTDKELSQLSNFADQAVIAIENARLLAELRESLDRQTATSEVLRAISSSPGNADPVFRQITTSVARICETEFSSLQLFDGSELKLAAMQGVPPDSLREWAAANPGLLRRAGPNTITGEVAATRRTVQITDYSASEAYLERDPVAVFSVEQIGVRSALGVPIIKDDRLLGLITVFRRQVRPFTEKQIELVENFADQAVIAIENARLLSELRESLERRTAMAEVLAMVSSSPGEVQPVFEAMLDNAVRLCNATEGSVFSVSGDVLRRVASRGLTADLAAHEELLAAPETGPGRMLSARKTVHVPDLLAEVEALKDSPAMAAGRAAAERGARSALWVPMIKDDALIGAFVLLRREARPFTPGQIGLVESFANQAVIAIENARLLAELRTARDAAESALGELRAAQANLIQAEKMASLGQLTAGIAHEIKNPLNFVNNFAALSVELLDELRETAASAMEALDRETRREIDEVVGMLTGNLDKIGEHGRRADGIVKSMLAHSRGGSGERQSVDLNALVEEALNLAYHGARAQDQNFNITLERDLDPSLAPIEVVPQDLTRVFLNLFGNGFYAANKRRMQAGDPAFEPVLEVATRDRGAEVEIRIRDNGIGMTPEIRAKLFEPFFTTKPTGEGTGLGLSISYEIVTRQHGGAIAVESEPGRFTEFSIRIPKRFGIATASENPMGSPAP